MFYRIFAAKDTFITSERLNGGVPRTGSNCGGSEILHVHKYIEANLTASAAHILTKFDLSEIADVTGSAVPQFWLSLTDTEHDQTLPSSFDLEIQAVTQDWDEGKGRDVDFFSDKGFANWDKAKSNVFWTVPGASGSGPKVTAHFDTGHENLDVNVTPIVEQWLSGNIVNNGLLIRMSSTLEADDQDYYVKMFHGRTTHFTDKRPFLEARWDDTFRDDRNNFFFGVSGTLFLNRIVRGELQNIPSVGTGSVYVRVADLSGTVASFTGSWSQTGRYSVSFAIPSGNFSGSTFNDIWTDSSANVLMSGTFAIGGNLNQQDVQTKRYFVSVFNLKDTYDGDERPRLDMFVRPSDYNPARVLTASLGANGTVVTKGYYKIVNDSTEDVVVPFGTGSLEYTRLSYDQKGNFFNLNMKSLAPGNVYRILFLLDVDGQRQYVDQSFKFRVI